MKKGIAAAAILFLVVQGTAMAGNVITFHDGNTEQISWLRSPTYTDYANLSIPANAVIGSATMDISTVLPDTNCSSNPGRVQIFLNDSLLWEFDGYDYGPFGMQNRFVDGRQESKVSFGVDGGNGSTSLRLMKTARAVRATMDVDSKGSGGLALSTSFFGPAINYQMGISVSDAGDVNGDGFDDIILGTIAGHAYIYFGGAVVNNSTALDLTGAPGYPVSGAGDVNGDGYDDVIVGGVVGSPYNGSARIFYGGPNMDGIPDVNLSGLESGDCFGCAVSSAGDMNKDGYDDVIVGARYAGDTGRAYIFYGGPDMDSNPDMTLSGENPDDEFGGDLQGVSGAGDVNEDGYDDVIVGAEYANGGSGKAYIYYGGANMDNTADVTFSGAAGSFLGVSVSDAGDVNKDGIDDVIIGANGGDMALIYFGAANMDNIADVTLSKAGPGQFGWSVSGTGDINNDGYCDVIVDGRDGFVYIYYGGTDIKNTPDISLSTPSYGESFGCKVSGGGDVDNDGYDDVIVGAYTNNNNGAKAGGAYLYSHCTGILQPSIQLDSKTIWNRSGYVHGGDLVNNFASILNDYLQAAPVSGTDEYGNAYVDVPIKLIAKNEGNISVGNLNITYTYKTTIPDFGQSLANYLDAHDMEKDPNGNISIPIKIVSTSPGRIKLSGLKIGLDSGPRLTRPIPDFQLAEDSLNTNLTDIRSYFQDDYDDQFVLKVDVASITNGSIVNVGIRDSQYLTADALNGPANDNWTGEVEVIVSCTNSRNQTRESNEFRIIIFNVNDPPVFTSAPPTTAITGEEYIYHVTAIDGDNDTLTYCLTKKPQNMTIHPAIGRINWVSPKGGGYEVMIEVTDGQAKNIQNYMIVVPNRPPRINNTTVPEAYVGIQYVYDVPAVDDDGNELNFGMLSTIPGMAIDPTTGRISWIPTGAGDFPVSIRIADKKDAIIYNFTVRVIMGNRIPQFTSKPILEAILGMPYAYDARASDLDGDALSYEIIEGPTGMTINTSTGRIFWTPDIISSIKVWIKVSDGKGGEAVQEYVIKVSEAIRPQLILATPQEGMTLKGTTTFSGTVTKGTREVIRVQLRIDEKDWADAAGNYSWSCKLDTKALKNGKHAFEFRAFDGRDYSDVVRAEFKVDNAVAAGKGFIPGPNLTLILLALAIVISLSTWAKKPRENDPEQALQSESEGE